MKLFLVQCESKKSLPCGFPTIFPNGWKFLIIVLHTYCTFLSTLDYKFLFNYAYRNAYRTRPNQKIGWPPGSTNTTVHKETQRTVF